MGVCENGGQVRLSGNECGQWREKRAGGPLRRGRGDSTLLFNAMLVKLMLRM
jgi:hypothetical protein